MANQTTAKSHSVDTDELDPSLVNIRDYLKEDYGIHFKLEKLYSLEHKLTRRLRDLSLDNYSEYEDYLRENTDEISNLLDEVSTNKTAFFREPKHWDFLIEEIIPDWQTRQESIKAWSIPCSTGEEPYSLSMVADDYLAQSGETAPASGTQSMDILASDVSRDALREARRGQYDQKRLQQVRNFDERYPEQYFREDQNGYHVINQAINRNVTLRTFNLNLEEYPIERAFDLIMCRNVLIYFTNDVISHVIRQLTNCLKPGGYLFIGHTESLYDIDHQLKKIRPSVFRRR